MVIDDVIRPPLIGKLLPEQGISVDDVRQVEKKERILLRLLWLHDLGNHVTILYAA